MEDRTAASAGFVAAGAGLAAALLPWPDPWGIATALLAVAALGVFALRRYGALDRRYAPFAAVAAAGLVVTGIGATFATGAASLGPALAGVVGAAAAALAYADVRGVTGGELRSMVSATASAAAVGFAGLFAIVIWGAAIASVVLRATPGEIDPSVTTALSTLALGLGTGTVAAVYLRATGRGIEFLDLRVPGLRDAGYVVGGVVALLGLNLAIGLAFEWLGVESATHSVVRTAEANPEILLVLVPLAYLVIGPGEELLYRNVVQKSLYGTFSRGGAVVVGSVVFAAVHVFAFSGPGQSAMATLNTLAVVFVLSLVLGAVYERTENVVASALVHGTFDAVAFVATYAQLTGV